MPHPSAQSDHSAAQPSLGLGMANGKTQTGELALRIPRELMDRYEAIAAVRQCPKGALMKQALEFYARIGEMGFAIVPTMGFTQLHQPGSLNSDAQTGLGAPRDLPLPASSEELSRTLIADRPPLVIEDDLPHLDAQSGAAVSNRPLAATSTDSENSTVNQKRPPEKEHQNSRFSSSEPLPLFSHLAGSDSQSGDSEKQPESLPSADSAVELDWTSPPRANPVAANNSEYASMKFQERPQSPRNSRGSRPALPLRLPPPPDSAEQDNPPRTNPSVKTGAASGNRTPGRISPADVAAKDAGLKTRISAALAEKWISVSLNWLHLEVREGVVTFWGKFKSESLRQLAIQITLLDPDVKSVVDHSRVSPPAAAAPALTGNAWRHTVFWKEMLVQHSRKLLITLAILIIGGSIWLLTGDGRPAVYPVAGQIRVEGEITPGATLVFHPVNADQKKLPEGLLPKAYVNPDGTFQVGTFRPRDGAPSGEYAVTIEWHPSTEKDGEAIVSELNVLPVEWSRPETTTLKIRIQERTNRLDPINLSLPIVSNS